MYRNDWQVLTSVNMAVPHPPDLRSLPFSKPLFVNLGTLLFPIATKDLFGELPAFLDRLFTVLGIVSVHDLVRYNKAAVLKDRVSREVVDELAKGLEVPPERC